jgi:outer membrane protein
MLERLVRKSFLLTLVVACGAMAQTPPRLTLQEAEALALRNHPQIQAAENEVAYANEQIVVNRAPYYPFVAGDLTGAQANNEARLGAGDVTAPRLFTRAGQGIVVSQLITDSGRTPNLVATARYTAQATGQTLNATRFDVLLAVNQAYYGVLRAQAAVKVAEQTVAARQTLADQITELARNQLRSQLDVSFADVTVSEAKLLLLRSQEAVQASYAELARALGSDQPINYQLVDEPMPPGPPAAPNDLVAQAINNRPELASLRASREAALRFFNAEKDLSRPTVTAVAVGGALPYINTPNVPEGYESVGAHVSIPVFNGHLFSARREAARQRALESEQRLRDQQERITRDVRTAWASAVTAFQSIDVTAQFLRQAALGLNLAQGRFDLGLASIVELTQAQLNLTEAEIENLNAKYDYQNQNALLQYTIGALR